MSYFNTEEIYTATIIYYTMKTLTKLRSISQTSNYFACLEKEANVQLPLRFKTALEFTKLLSTVRLWYRNLLDEVLPFVEPEPGSIVKKAKALPPTLAPIPEDEVPSSSNLSRTSTSDFESDVSSEFESKPKVFNFMTAHDEWYSRAKALSLCSVVAPEEWFIRKTRSPSLSSVVEDSSSRSRGSTPTPMGSTEAVFLALEAEVSCPIAEFDIMSDLEAQSSRTDSEEDLDSDLESDFESEEGPLDPRPGRHFLLLMSKHFERELISQCGLDEV